MFSGPRTCEPDVSSLTNVLYLVRNHFVHTLCMILGILASQREKKGHFSKKQTTIGSSIQEKISAGRYNDKGEAHHEILTDPLSYAVQQSMHCTRTSAWHRQRCHSQYSRRACLLAVLVVVVALLAHTGCASNSSSASFTASETGSFSASGSPSDEYTYTRSVSSSSTDTLSASLSLTEEKTSTVDTMSMSQTLTAPTPTKSDVITFSDTPTTSLTLSMSPDDTLTGRHNPADHPQRVGVVHAELLCQQHQDDNDSVAERDLSRCLPQKRTLSPIRGRHLQRYRILHRTNARRRSPCPRTTARRARPAKATASRRPCLLPKPGGRSATPRRAIRPSPSIHRLSATQSRSRTR